MTGEELRIGTRGSALALWQAGWVRDSLMAGHPGLRVTLVPIKTTGDKILDVPLAQVGGKGLFVKELEEALLSGVADLAVHSMKDVPSEFPEGLGLGPILEREDPRDALLAVRFGSLAALPVGAVVGSSSLRRRSQLLHRRPDVQVVSLRGNVNTRIAKLEEGQFDAIVLAAAGVKRLQLTRWVVEYLEEMLPAVWQGAVGIEYRLGDERVGRLIAPLDHEPTRQCLWAERAMLSRLEGGCQVPIAAHAVLNGGVLTLEGMVAELDGSRLLRVVRSGSVADPVALGREVAEVLLSQGADHILAAVYAQAATGPPLSGLPFPATRGG